MHSIGLIACGCLILLWAVCFELNYRERKEREDYENENKTK